MSTIAFSDVSKEYGGQVVLDQYTMNVGLAEMAILLGGSGSGKTTILKMVLGLVRPDSGTVVVNGQEVSALHEEDLYPLRSEIGMVFQGGALFDSLPVGDNVAYRLREQGKLTEAEIRERVVEMLTFVGLESAVDRMPSELSGGMRRRVAIARALVGNPRIMLYDEPTAGLDPITSRTMCELVMKLRDLEGVTSIFVTHDLHSARTLARERAVKKTDGQVAFEECSGTAERTRFVILEKGRVLLDGIQADLDQTADPYIREFLD